ncbi:MAG: DUF554 domain-containing protein [Clostridia bacterium]|nr:DUF554 domain-containing protein [Clostridia bacterium]
MFGIFKGVIINALLVIAGTAAGLLFNTERMKTIGERIFQAFAIFVACMGVAGAISIDNTVLVLGCLIVGIALGELIDIDDKFNRLGNWLQNKVSGGKNSDSRFANGFISASLLFCIGSMTFMGALESGLQNQHTIYITKGVLDAISAVTLTMGNGIGVAFSALMVLVYQGLLTLGASVLAPVLSPEMVAVSSQIGSLFLVGIALNMLEIKKIKVANFLPAMFMPFIWQAVLLIFNK